MHKIIWTVAAAVGTSGLVAFVADFDKFGSPWRLLGLTLLIMGCVMFNAGLQVARSRTLDEEFDAGYRAGYRVGRRVGLPSVVVSMEGRRGSGRHQAPPVGPLAGHRPASRRHSANEV